MKLLFLLSALLVSLLLAAKVSADFMIYRYDHDGRTLKDYNMLFTSNPAHFHAPPSCSELETAELFFVQWRADVVGRRGFVLEGDNASPRRLEWNMPKEGHHFTIYHRDGGYKMYDAADNEYGSCELVYLEETFECQTMDGRLSGGSQFRCTSPVNYNVVSLP